MPYAISYTRFSTGRQTRGTSLERQNDMVQSYCKENNLQLLHSFHDAGKSGFHAHHLDAGGQLHALLEKLETGEIPKGTHLLIEQTDRLSRQPIMDALNIIQRLTSSGLVIVTLDDKQKYHHEMGFSGLISLASRFHRGHDESKSKSERLSKVWSNKAKEMEQGIVPKMRLPFWLQRTQNGEVEILSESKALIERVLRLCVEGYGCADIALMLNNEGITTSTGNHWNNSKLSKLIRNKQLIGWHTRKGTKELHYCLPPAISLDLFNDAQRALDTRVRSKGNTAKWASALSGLANCGQCGSVLKFSGKGKYRTGVCRAAVDGASTCQNKRSIRYKALILGAVAALGTSLGELLDNAKPKSTTADKSALEADIQRTEAQISRVVEAISTLGDVNVRELSDRLKQLKEARDRQKQELAALAPEIDQDQRMLQLLKTMKTEVPEMTSEVLEGSKAAANRLNILFKSVEGFKVILDNGVAHIGSSRVWIEGKTMWFENEAVGQAKIVSANSSVRTETFITSSGHQIPTTMRGIVLCNEYELDV